MRRIVEQIQFGLELGNSLNTLAPRYFAQIVIAALSGQAAAQQPVHAHCNTTLGTAVDTAHLRSMVQDEFIRGIQIYFEEAVAETASLEAVYPRIADTNSRKLLLSVLNQEQREQFTRYGSFEVKVLDRVFTIRDVRVNSVKDKSAGTVYCITVPNAPIYDQMAGIKLLLETDLGEFLRIANVMLGAPHTSRREHLYFSV